MPIDANIAALLEQLAGVEPPASLDALRQATDTTLRHWHGPLEAVDRTETFSVPTRDGRQIRVRAYWPAVTSACAAGQPAIVYAHGGGWCLGTLELYDNPCCALANATQCVVLSVDYRLAPEHRFPVPLEDFYDALDWVVGEASGLGLDPARIAVGGDSAGGNLAAAVCLVAREHGGPSIAHQLLLYPPLDVSMSTTSYRTCGQGYYLTQEIMRYCFDLYLADADDGSSSCVSPLRAASLEGLPPATLLACEYDPVRDDALAYAERLGEASVPVDCVVLPGMIHACIHMAGVTPAARRVFDVAGAQMRRAFRR
ncbi:TPA: alpha/beta hydrolase [Burkholderia aenigmatica]|uniref:alpha/beta hydrolase n=1 Tax=Burkholderia sp. AU45251 TaxID=3059204 RepID=UPI002652AB2F|nr:alpha/beta hydrolase [Burkholderia sp. AU45251]HDR9484643.1 alpha/beta hydrolase [Burkholderia aenigmatica]MDN7516758.1 alpha/beta hydrolase [Burkholderia sp. AU45251]HDR9515919.1 alpha/beta hydrolase [Burkholderia aenigmatica]HDR9592728.1 alpha/beta hydrolase [Burkholderia aenigmatica]HDR9599708.1 alpha/beta hydrolase [Burkholderia aenigmatica]